MKEVILYLDEKLIMKSKKTLVNLILNVQSLKEVSCSKKKLIYEAKPKTFEETKKSLFKYIEGWDNNHRIQKN